MLREYAEVAWVTQTVVINVVTRAIFPRPGNKQPPMSIVAPEFIPTGLGTILHNVETWQLLSCIHAT